ncbi:MAG TPA: formylmethanofuran dehydrogenase [Methanosarcinaceae archaeon]|nr:formylmethanofuran dehydrogenase [Methanosarcinaceae archaeon]
MDIRIELTAPVNNICDYTFDFHWQNQQLDPVSVIPDQSGTQFTYSDLVDALKGGTDIHIKGDVGARFAYSLGVNLKHSGGSGNSEFAGRVFVDGNVGEEAGMGMVSGTLYISGDVAEPLGNIIEVGSDVQGYRKFRSITDILYNGLDTDTIISNIFDEEERRLTLDDGIVRGTLGARCGRMASIVVEGDAYNGTGLLMRHGMIIVKGDAGMNTGAHLDGGTVIVLGTVDEFAGAYMKGGVLVFKNAKGYVGAGMKDGAIYSKKKVKTSPPSGKSRMKGKDSSLLKNLLDIGRVESMLYNKYEIEEEKEKYITVHMRDGSVITRKVE